MGGDMKSRWTSVFDNSVTEEDGALYQMGWWSVGLASFLRSVLLGMGILGAPVMMVFGQYFSPRRLLARVDSDSVMLTLPGNARKLRIEMPLPALRALKVEGPSFCFHGHDGQIKCVRPGYSPAARADVIAFLQRRLPASVALEVDQPKTDQTSAP
jgi:hypothetical protein